MPEEEIHHQPEQGDKKTIAKPAKRNHTLLIVIICIVVGILLLSIGGYLGYRYYKKKQQDKQLQAQLEQERRQNSTKPVNGTLLFSK